MCSVSEGSRDRKAIITKSLFILKMLKASVWGGELTWTTEDSNGNSDVSPAE